MSPHEPSRAVAIRENATALQRVARRQSVGQADAREVILVARLLETQAPGLTGPTIHQSANTLRRVARRRTVRPDDEHDLMLVAHLLDEIALVPASARKTMP